ncbi:MAG TPA: hypothetical protein PLV68_17710, partial [Ilumatobacteraceae bacterium]|nr:hypothetical protein [Ilumatobacteraceae bacterium]
HRDERSVRVFSPAGLKAFMSVDGPLDLQNQDQVWFLEWANTSQTGFNPSQVIYVFPFVGDSAPGSGSQRQTYGSEYAGTLQLTGP